MKIIPLFTMSAILLCGRAALADEISHTADFIDVGRLDSSIMLDMRYASQNNFVGKVIDGYQSPSCVLKKDAALALAAANQAALKEGVKLKLFDCYRPKRAVAHFVRWVEDQSDVSTKSQYYPNLDKPSLLGEYIAPQSGHSRGYTVDLTLMKHTNTGWEALDMGGEFDLFDPISNTAHEPLSDEAKVNRLRLKTLLEGFGFVNYDMEWWHYTHQSGTNKTQAYDFVLDGKTP